jgi:zinc/manganese transport system substrate-binding protein
MRQPVLRRLLRLNLAAVAILVASVGLTACACSSVPSSPVPSAPLLRGPSPAGDAAPIAVLGTENFYADLLSQVGGARVTASSLLNDPNADPHAFESSTQAAVAVADARLVIVNGLGYDAFMDKLLAASPNPNRNVINVQQLLGLADGANAHIWYDPPTMPAVAAQVAAALAVIDPANAFYFKAREALYVASLAPVTAKIAEMKTRFGGAPVAFTEPVAGYQATAIGLQVLTPEGFQKSIEDGTDPAPADVAGESDLLTGKKVKVLIYNSQVTSPITSKMHDLAVANGIPVVGVAETIPGAYSDYVSWQLGQLNQLEQALAAGG